MVRKGFARLVLQDCLRQRAASDATATASEAATTATASEAATTASGATATASEPTATASNATATATAAPALLQQTQHSKPITEAQRPQPLVRVQVDTTARTLGSSAAELSSEKDTAAAAGRHPGSLGDSAAEGCAAAGLGFSVDPKLCSGSPEPLHEALNKLGDSAAGNVEDKRLEQAALEASAADFQAKVAPGSLLGLECGNMYAGQHLAAR